MVEVEISSFDVVEGSRRIYIHPMFGESGSGLSGANEDDSVLVAVVGRAQAWLVACCVGGAGRDLRHVGVRGGESVWGRAAGRALMLRSARSSVASWRSGMTRFGAAGVGRADGRGVVMRCDEPLARRWWGKAHDWSGLVWCKSGLPAGISRWSGLLLVGWRAARLSRSCHKRRETWWDGGRYVETISACRREGRDELGRVNTVSR